jgi:hypothetical protein
MAVFLSTVDKSVVDELERRVKFNNYLDDPNSDRTYIQWQQRTP